VQEYVLPDFSPNSTSRTGYIRSGPNAARPEYEAQAEEEQVLWMGNERFAGPELLFNPSDIGLKQSGLPETIALVISMMPAELQGMFWAHIGVFGGLGNIPDFGERLCVHCKLDSVAQLMKQRT
jgi:actin-related protein 6